MTLSELPDKFRHEEVPDDCLRLIICRVLKDPQYVAGINYFSSCSTLCSLITYGFQWSKSEDEEWDFWCNVLARLSDDRLPFPKIPKKLMKELESYREITPNSIKSHEKLTSVRKIVF